MNQIVYPKFADISLRYELVDILPRPLAYTYRRLIEEVESGQSVPSIWALRDAWECAIRFTACLGLADLVQAEASGERFDTTLSRLFKKNGLSFGDWAFIMRTGCDRSVKTVRPRLLPGLPRIYKTDKGLLTEVGLALDRAPAKATHELDPRHVNVITWRNRVFGHGVYHGDQDWYDLQTVSWIPPLHFFYDMLTASLDGWALRDGGASGSTLMGVGQGTVAGRHRHVAIGATQDVVLAGPGVSLGFGPLLSAQTCNSCGERLIFLYDKSTRKKPGPDFLQTDLLDYLQGHQGELYGWLPAIAWEGRLPKDHIWERGAFDQEDAEEKVKAIFRNSTDYCRPDWIMDRLWLEIEGLNRGYVHLVAPAGTGKSYLARAIKEEDGVKRGIPVLLYHILTGSRSDYRTFISMLADEAKGRLNNRTQEINAKGHGAAGLRQQFVEFLACLMKENHLSRLVVVLDGLDELPPRCAGDFAITDFLVPADDLPEGCVVVLTGSANLRPGIAERLLELRTASDASYREIVLDVDDAENRRMLTGYVLKRLPEGMQRAENAEDLADRCGGVFLYAFHMVQALNSGAFASMSDLPPADDYYRSYLNRLRERVGKLLYEDVFLPVLLNLAAAQVPVTLDQLKSWGQREDRLQVALFVLADFIEEIRTPAWHERVGDDDLRPRFRIAHREFVSLIEKDTELALKLRATHADICSIIHNRHDGRWESLDTGSEEDIYAARFLETHEQLSMTEASALGEGILRRSAALVKIGEDLFTSGKWRIAEEILRRCVANFRRAVEREGRNDLSKELFVALSKHGGVLQKLNCLDEAEANQRESLTIIRRLVDQEGRNELMADLSSILSHLGLVLEYQQRLNEAERCQRESVAIHRFLVERLGRKELIGHLAKYLENHGAVLGSLNRLDHAEACLYESLTIQRQLAKQEEGEELTDDFSAVLTNYGQVLQKLNRLDEAEIYQRECVDLLRRRVEAEGRTDLANDLATALCNHGVVLQALGCFEEAERCQRESVAIMRRLVEMEGRREFSDSLAAALGNHASVLFLMKRPGDAEECQRENVGLYRSLVERDGRKELAGYFATGLGNHGVMLQALKLSKEAEAAHREEIIILRRLVEQGNCEDSYHGLAMALSNRGSALKLLDRFDESEECQSESVSIWRQLVEREGRKDLTKTLATALHHHGMILQALNRPGAAETCHGESVFFVRRLVEQEGRKELAHELANALYNYAGILLELTRVAEAEICLREAVAIRRRLVEQEGRKELRDQLSAALSLHGQVLQFLKRRKGAKKSKRK